MITVVVRTAVVVMAGRSVGSASADGDLDRRGVGQGVEHRGALLRLRDEPCDLLGGRVRVDVEVDVDVLEAVPDLRVATQDAQDVVLPLDRRLDGAELDAAMLRDGRDTRGEAA